MATVIADGAPHLPDGEGPISELARSLSSRVAHCLAEVCPRWRAILSQPAFLCSHLALRPLADDDRPRAIIVQPRKIGFTHLALVATDPADQLAVDVPARNKYRRLPRAYHLNRDRTDGSAAEKPEPEPEPDQFAVHPWPALKAVDDDHVAFFERTVPALDVSIVAAHGRLLLCRGRSCYYVCDPAANRWVALPPSTLPTEHDTNSGLHYDDLDAAATGRLAFTVVLIVRPRHRRVIVENFTSATGMWETRELPVQGPQGLHRCLGPASPGIHVGGCFYWLSRRHRRIVRYDVASGRVSVVREPPEPEGSIGRASRSLGSTDRGQQLLRMCAIDIRDKKKSMLPHEGAKAVHGVWVMDGGGGGAPAPAAWQQEFEVTVGGIHMWYFYTWLLPETVVDFAGACSDFIITTDNSGSRFWRYDYGESGSKVELASLSVKLGELYRSN